MGPALKQVAVIMSQHIGAPCKATVAKRQEVQANEIIGDSEAFVSAKIHSPVSGVVKDIANRSHPVLGREIAVVIDVSEDYSPKLPSPESFEDFDLSKYSQDEILDSITQCGIVGMGGAGFPTNIKVAPNEKMPKHTMIVNACECEPYITCDYRVMMEWTKQFVAGVKLIKKASGCKTVYIGIEINKPRAIEAIDKVLTETKDSENISIVSLKTKYPQGGERQLIDAVMGKAVPTGTIPPMIGLLVCNVATAAATADAVVLKQPLTHRVVTVSGKGIKNPGNFYCPIGITVQELIDNCGGMTTDAVKVILGGPMMGFSIADLNTPTTKTTGSVLVLTKKEVNQNKYLNRQTNCIKCGRCIDVCPEGLLPCEIANSIKAGKIDRAMDFYMTACMECGCCSYVCPANAEVTGLIKTGKILNARNNKK